MAQLAPIIDLTDPNAQTAQLDLQRRQQMIDALRQQAMAPMQSQTAGGYVIPVSPLEGIAKLGQAYFANKGQEKITQQQSQLMQDRANRIAQALKSYGTVSEPTPPDMTQLGVGPSGGVSPTFSMKSRPATPDEQMQQDWQLTQLDPAFAKVLEARHTREQTQQDKLEQIKLQREMMAQQAALANKPFSQIVYTSDGAFSYDVRTKQLEPLINPATGKQIKGAQYDPALQREIAGGKAGATELAKATTEAGVKLPQVVATANDLSRHIDELIGSQNGAIAPHPGMSGYLGTSGAMGYIPKTAAADFKSRLEQLQGGTFLQAYNTLRGGGQITEVEGAKATAALNRAKAAQNEAAFTSALRDFQNIVNQGAERARQAAQGNYQAPQPYAPVAPAVPANNVDYRSQADKILGL